MACNRGEGKGSTFEKKYNVDPPHTGGHHDGNLIHVPNCNTRSIDEHYFEKDDHRVETMFRTYMRRTISSEAVAIAR
jgi:hypothetical protein